MNDMMQMSGIEHQPHSSLAATPAAVTSDSMNDHETQQQQQRLSVSGTDMTMMDDAASCESGMSNPDASGSNSSISIGIGSIDAPALNVDPSVTHPIDVTDQSGHGDTASSASSSPSSRSSSSSSASVAAAMSETTSTPVEHQRRKRDVMTGDGNQKRMRMQRKAEVNAADADKTGDKDEEQKTEQHSAARLSPSISMPIAQRLYHDGLHSIFRWLTMRELNAAARTCKSWYAASISHSFRLGRDLKVKALHRSFVYSLLRHHLSGIHLQAGLTMPQLAQLDLASLNNVVKLKLMVTTTRHLRASISPLPLLPPHLTSLDLIVDVGSYTHCVCGAQELLCSAIGSCHRLECLTINGFEYCDFTPLRQLTKLRSFVLNGDRLSVELARVLCELPLLEEVSFGWEAMRNSGTRRNFLRALCSADDHHDGDEEDGDDDGNSHPHPHLYSHIRSLDLLFWFLQPDDVALLTRLPSLTSLRAEMSEDCCEVLPLLRLEELTLDSPSWVLLSAVPRMSTLTCLKLTRCLLSSEIGMELMKGLPCLETLELHVVLIDGNWDG